MSPVGTRRELAIASWAIGGVALTFVEAIVRMAARAVHLLGGEMDTPRWLCLIMVVALFCYGEGYRALQRRFVPHVVERAVGFSASASGCLTILSAPLHALSLVGANRRELARAWIGVGLIVGAVLVVRALPPVWRGLVDAGVAAALSWGLVALVTTFIRVLVAPRWSKPSGDRLAGQAIDIA